MRLALDADAFNFSRSLGLLPVLVELVRRTPPAVSLMTTKYVARHELNSLAAELEALVQAGYLTVEELRTGTPAFKLFRTLQRTWDKGESELAAWLTHHGRGWTLVSCDVAVRNLAREQRLQHQDLGELAVALVRQQLVEASVLEHLLRPWASPHVGLGRPAWWTSFAAAMAGRCHP